MATLQKILSFEELKGLNGEPTVHCHGVFDIIHAGHLAYFKSAKEHGKILVITLTSDRYVNKGPGRPYFTDKIRAQVLAALDIVDFVCISDHPTAVPAIEKLRPKVYVKGPDYKDKTKDVTGEIYNEEKAVKKAGGQVFYTDDETFSSSQILNKFFVNWSDEQKSAIARIKGLGGEERVRSEIDKLSRLTVVVSGEPITDTYRFCIPENLSSKSPSISARYQYEENYDGGSTAITNHLKEFIKAGVFIIPSNLPGIRKTRYITVDKSQRIFEITEIPPDSWTVPEPREFIEELKHEAKRSDLTILADFGHRLFEGDILDSLTDLEGFVALNVQTNSSNFGFNVFKKHSRFNYLSIDTREARLAYHDRDSDPYSLALRCRTDLEGKSMSMTLGPNGSYFFHEGKEFYSPAFVDTVIDATGAGDAYFAITSCLVRSGCHPELVPFIGNVFAGLKTKIIGNKSHVKKADLLKAISSILK